MTTNKEANPLIQLAPPPAAYKCTPYLHRCTLVRTMRHKIALLSLAAATLASAAEVKTSPIAKNVVEVKIKSEALGTERNAHVILPVDYETSTRRYPVLYLLHGLGDDHKAWAYMTNTSGYAAKYPLIIVMPDGGRSWYVNSAAAPKDKYEDFIAKDLITFTDSNFRTIPLPRARAIAGLSMGGYGASMIGLKHFKKYAALASFSGAVGFARSTPPSEDAAARQRTAPFDAIFGAPGSKERAEKDPFALLEKVPASDMPMIYLACGGQDFLIQQNRDFVKLLGEKKVPYEYREVSPFGHTWDFWDDHIKVFLGMLASKTGFGE